MSLDPRERITALTAGHRKLHSILVERLGLEVMDEFPVGRYVIDCYVPEVHLGFEHDGKDFHTSPKRRERDRGRDAWILEEAGIPIYRVPASRLANKAEMDRLVEDLMAWIEGEAVLIEERRAKGRMWT